LPTNNQICIENKIIIVGTGKGKHLDNQTLESLIIYNPKYSLISD